MARPGKEKVFFFASLGLTGLLGTLLMVEEFRAPQVPPGKSPDRAAYAFGGVPRAPRGALDDRDWTGSGREAFREPRDWLPLPPAALERPPLRDPSYVPPVPEPAAALARRGIYRRPTEITPHEFAGAAGTDGEATEEGGETDAAVARAAPAANGGSPSASAPLLSEDEELKQRFDWLELAADPRPWYVVIKNEDKFGLPERPDEKVEFVRIDPKTNRVMIGGALERSRIKPGGIHFAATPSNLAEQALRKLPESAWSTSTLPQLLDAAKTAIDLGAQDPACHRAAAARLERWVALDPKHARTHELLADVRAALLDYEGELGVLLRAEQAGVEAPGLAVRRARWLARAGALDGARARLAAAVQRWPNDRGARLAYGRALLREGSPESIETALQQFAQAEQGSATSEQRMEVIAEAGAALLERGDATRALAEAKRILKIDDEARLGWRLEGGAEFALGHLTDAESAFARLRGLARTPAQEAEALLALGVVRSRLGSFDQARADLRRVPELDPLQAPGAAVAEAELLATTGHADDALVRARDAVAGRPDDPFLRYYLGRALRRAGDLEAAGVELRRALILGEAFPALFDELGFLALLLGRGEDARRYFEESVAREPRDEARLLLAHAHLLNGEIGKARPLFESLQAARTTSATLLGLAFCAYRGGESLVAQQLWIQVRDELKDADPDDVAYARRWLDDVLDRESKQGWEDTLQWAEVGNGWNATTSQGPTLRSTPPGNVRISGVQKPGSDVTAWSYLSRDVDLALFHDFEVECQFAPGHQGRMGMGLVHWMAAAGNQAPRLRAALTLALDADGTLWLQRCESVGHEAFVKIGTHEIAAGQGCTITLRRQARGDEHFQFFIDGAPVGEPLEMTPWKGRGRQQVSAVFFGAAPGGRTCDVRLETARRVEYLAQ